MTFICKIDIVGIINTNHKQKFKLMEYKLSENLEKIVEPPFSFIKFNNAVLEIIKAIETCRSSKCLEETAVLIQCSILTIATRPREMGLLWQRKTFLSMMFPWAKFTRWMRTLKTPIARRLLKSYQHIKGGSTRSGIEGLYKWRLRIIVSRSNLII